MDQSSAIERTYLTLRQAAALLQISPHFLRRLIQKKQIPAFRVGLVGIRLRAADLTGFVEANPVLGPAEVRDCRRKSRRPGCEPHEGQMNHQV